MKIGGELLSRNRMELYGIATLGIILVHAQSVVVSLPAAVLKVLSFGGIGVYIFAFCLVLGYLSLWINIRPVLGGLNNIMKIELSE